MEKEINFGPHKIPQIEDINTYLDKKTGFKLYPVAGLLEPREFLNFLAYRLFPST